MDYLLTGIVLITLFFSLRTNYKISDFEENQKKINQKQKEEYEKLITNLIKSIHSIDKKLIFFQKTINDLKEDHDKSSMKNLNLLKKQLSGIKNDTDLMKTLYLKSNSKTETDKSRSKNEPDPFSLIKQKQTVGVVSMPIIQEKKESFSDKVNEKLKNLDGDERWILKQILGQEHGKWQNISDLETDVSMPKFKIPKLSRQFMIEGLPILMIKHAGDKMFVKWGEGLTDEKIEDIRNEIRGDY